MPKLPPFTQAMRAALQREGMLPERGVVVVACSGGADSVALLLALHEVCGPGHVFPEISLHVAHLDHGLRPASAADASFVADLAAKLDLPVTTRRLEPDITRVWRGSLEANARATRYAFLREVARAVGAERIALGHTLDDQAETTLMHFLRGSGLAGLAGMRPVAGALIRPLLEVRHAATVAFCQSRGVTPREDETNRDPRFTRNRIRLELLPLLETYQTNIIPILARNADIIAADLDYLNAETERAWDECVTSANGPEHTLDREALRALPPALRRRVLLRAAQAANADDPEAQVTFDSIQRLERVVMDHIQDRRVVQLSNGTEAVVAGKAVTLHNS